MKRTPRWVVAGAVLLATGAVGCNCRPDAGADGGSDAGSDAAPPFELDSGPPLTDGVDPTVAAAPGEARAGRVTPGAATVLLTADAAEGQPGDFLLYNTCVRIVVQDARPGDGYIPGAGSIIDADLVRPAGTPDVDFIDELDTIFGIARVFSATEVGVLADGSGGGAAVVRAIGGDEELELVTGAVGLPGQAENLAVIQDYVLVPDACHVEIRTTVVAIGPHTTPLGIGDFVVFSDDVGDAVADRSGFTPEGLLSTHAWVGMADEKGQLAVALFPAAGPKGGVELVNPLGDLLSQLGGNGIYLYWIDQRNLPSFTYETLSRTLALGPDLDRVTRAYHAEHATADLATISGTVTDAGGAPVGGARVHLLATTGPPGTRTYVTFAVSAADGTYAAEVPAGDYEVSATATGPGWYVPRPGPVAPPLFPFADGRVRSAPLAVTVAAAGTVTADPVVGDPGAVDLTISDGGGMATSARATFRRAGPDPSPADPHLGERDGSGSDERTFWTVDGRVVGPIAPGTYDLIVARGFDAEADIRPGVVVPAGGTLVIADLVVTDVVDHAGYLATDTHVHAAASLDAECSNLDRVGTVMGEGLDFFVSTDHDFVVDYTPALVMMGVTDRLSFVFAEEVSTVSAGHFNPFPVLRPDLPSGGAVRWWATGLVGADLFAAIRAELDPGVIQVNHGRRSSAFFEAAGYDPSTGLPTEPAYWGDDFDAMEILNDDNYSAAEDLLLDWYSLLNLGRRIIGTGSSDAHDHGGVGYGRSYVAVAEPDPALLLPEEVADGFRSGNVIISGGPFLVVSIDGAPPGGDVDGSAGTVTLVVEVRAPSWMPVDEVSVVANGVTLMTIPVTAAAPPVWLAATVPLSPASDTWYVVRADGASDLGPVMEGRRAFAVSNPIFVDVDGGGFDAPGL